MKGYWSPNPGRSLHTAFWLRSHPFDQLSSRTCQGISTAMVTGVEQKMGKENEVSKNKNCSGHSKLWLLRKKKVLLTNRTVDEEHRFKESKGYRAFEGGASPPVPARAPAAGYPPATCTQGAEFSAVACFTSVWLLSPPKQATVLFNSSHYWVGPSLVLTTPACRGKAYGARSLRCQASPIPSTYLWEPFFVDMVHHNYFMVTAGGGTSRAASKANYPFKPDAA